MIEFLLNCIIILSEIVGVVVLVLLILGLVAAMINLFQTDFDKDNNDEITR